MRLPSRRRIRVKPTHLSVGGVTFYSARTAILSVFVAWMVKTIILRVGSISLYRRAAPFFVGMIVGYTFGLMMSMVVDLIWFPGQGHSIFWGD